MEDDAIFSWDQSTLEAIQDACCILMKLIAKRLKQQPLPLQLLNLLAVVLDPSTNYHAGTKNQHSDPSCGLWIRSPEKGEKVLVVTPFHAEIGNCIHPRGWLVDMINIVSCI